MPLYEYQCKKCKKTYEALVSISKADDPGKCPHCGFEKSETKKYSIVSINQGI